jgi:hypothetical protein
MTQIMEVHVRDPGYLGRVLPARHPVNSGTATRRRVGASRAALGLGARSRGRADPDEGASLIPSGIVGARWEVVGSSLPENGREGRRRGLVVKLAGPVV